MHREALVTLTALTGRSVLTPDRQAAGVVRDLTVRLGGDRPSVERVLVTRHRERRLVPWSVVEDDGDRVVIHSAPGQPVPQGDELDLDADELLLARDVLDCQIIDLEGRRLTRASDVVLARDLEGGLALVGVEVGLGAVLRRLGLGWLSGRSRRQVIPIDQLHLSSARGHQVQLAVTTSAVHRLDAAGLSHLVTRLDVDKATDVLGAVGPERAAEVLLRTHPVVGRRLMSALPDVESSRVRRHLPPGSTRTHPHLHERGSTRPRRLRRLAGWRTHHPPEVPG
jgi:hypothetical protein